MTGIIGSCNVDDSNQDRFYRKCSAKQRTDGPVGNTNRRKITNCQKERFQTRIGNDAAAEKQTDDVDREQNCTGNPGESREEESKNQEICLIRRYLMLIIIPMVQPASCERLWSIPTCAFTNAAMYSTN